LKPQDLEVQSPKVASKVKARYGQGEKDTE